MGKPEADPAAANVPQEKWPTYSALLSRTFPGDLGACQHCGGKLLLIACIDEPIVIRRILSHLGLPTEAPVAAPARSPPQLDLEEWGYEKAETFVN